MNYTSETIQACSVRWGQEHLGLPIPDKCKCMDNEENPCFKADKDNKTIYSFCERKVEGCWN